MAGFNKVMTLDAGGTSFRFRALRGNQQVTQTIAMPTEANSLSQKKRKHETNLLCHLYFE
jgi:hypothetical protein